MPRAPQGPPNSYSNDDAGLTGGGGGLLAALVGLVILTCLALGLGEAAAATSTSACGGGSDARDVGAFFREGLAEGVVGAAAEVVGAMVARRLGAFGVAAATAAAAFLLPGDRRARVLTMLACFACFGVWLFVNSACASEDGEG